MEKGVILYVGGFIPPDKNAAAHRVLANAKILKSLGYEVVFLGNTMDKKIKHKEIYDTKCSINNFTTYLSEYPSGLVEWFKQLVLIDKIDQVVHDIGASNIRVIVAYNYPSIALKRLIKYCKDNKIYLISDCTEWAIADNKYSIRGLLKNLDTFYRMKFIHFELDGLIAISQYLYNYYSKRMKNVIKLPPLIDKNEEKWIKSDDLNPYKGIQLVYAGSPGKGNKDRLDLIVESCINAAKKTKKKITLTVIGITKEYFLSNFDKGLSSDSLKNINFMGRVSHKKALDITKKSHFSIFIRDENIITKAGFPTKFVESIGCGTPVLTNSTSNLSEYLIEGKMGYFLNVSSKKELTKSLIRVVEEEKKIHSMKKYCGEVAIFDISYNKDKITKLINNLSIHND